MRILRCATVLGIAFLVFAVSSAGAKDKGPGDDRDSRLQAPRIPVERITRMTCPKGWHVFREEGRGYRCGPDHVEQPGIKCPPGTVWHRWTYCHYGCKDVAEGTARPEKPTLDLSSTTPPPRCPRGWHYDAGTRTAQGGYLCDPDRPTPIRCPEGTVWHEWSDCHKGCMEVSR